MRPDIKWITGKAEAEGPRGSPDQSIRVIGEKERWFVLHFLHWGVRMKYKLSELRLDLEGIKKL